MRMSEYAQVLLVNRGIVLNDENQLLLIRRSADDVRNADLWEFPGGKVDAGEDIHQSLVREVMEETGLYIVEKSDLIYYENEIIRSGRHGQKLYVALFHAVTLLAGDVRLSNEHSAYAWDTLDQARNRSLTDESRRALNVFHKTNLLQE